MGASIAHHPASAVEIDNCRQAILISGRADDADFCLAGRTDAKDGIGNVNGRFGNFAGLGTGQNIAGLGRGQGVDRRAARCFQGIDEVPGGRFKNRFSKSSRRGNRGRKGQCGRYCGGGNF
eukprot:NODE_3733_length_858_cov_1.172367_g3710_i0.p2 GENE.NODE_3733_length_858_cov_1.172367_g3710_i0~~NODE_3733_length_858_cov_1.172367_g3710_i0.p2  ORF type:complete len:121 (-),score=6.67 NODE_3733_length_858_cov_1.172367_g3710_i0:165-527(-)